MTFHQYLYIGNFVFGGVTGKTTELLIYENQGNGNTITVIDIDETDEGVATLEDGEILSINSSPDIEIISEKVSTVTRGLASTSRSSNRKQKGTMPIKNPQQILSKFNFPNRQAFAATWNFIPLKPEVPKDNQVTMHSKDTQNQFLGNVRKGWKKLGTADGGKRRTRNSMGYRFDPQAKANTNFTPLVEQTKASVFEFQGSGKQFANKR